MDESKSFSTSAYPHRESNSLGVLKMNIKPVKLEGNMMYEKEFISMA